MHILQAGRAAFSATSLRQTVLLWSLFFLICMGLGYPTLNRYNPALTPGLVDAGGYSSLVTGTDLAGDESHRILVPYLARPIYWLVKGHLNTWDPVYFALLVVNSCFIAATALFLVSIGRTITGDWSVALLSGFVYLANFAVANFNLCGYVDSAVNCMMIAIAWALLKGRWGLLPLWGVLGAMTKETFVPMAAALAFAWWLAARRRDGLRLSRLAWLGTMTIVAVATVTLLMMHGSTPTTPLSFAEVRWSNAGMNTLYFSGLVGCLFARENLFVFGWLLPLGIWRLGRLPWTWVVGSACAALAVLAMGAIDIALGNVVRPLFSAIGPVLSLSVAILLVEAGGRQSETESLRSSG